MTELLVDGVNKFLDACVRLSYFPYPVSGLTLEDVIQTRDESRLRPGIDFDAVDRVVYRIEHESMRIVVTVYRTEEDARRQSSKSFLGGSSIGQFFLQTDLDENWVELIELLEN